MSGFGRGHGKIRDKKNCLKACWQRYWHVIIPVFFTIDKLAATEERRSNIIGVTLHPGAKLEKIIRT